MFDEEIAKVASQQYGMFDLKQLNTAGGKDWTVHDRLSARRWTHEGDGVYGFPDWPNSWMRSLWREYLIVGRDVAIVGAESAASLQRLHPFPRFGRIELLVPHGFHHRPTRAVVRQVRDLTEDHVETMFGLRVTKVARTLCDLAASAHRERLSRAIEQADLDKKCGIAETVAMYEALRKPGKPGFKMLGEILEVRGDDFVVPEGELDRMFRRLCKRFNLREPIWRPHLPWDPTRRADALWLPEKALLELDSRTWHGRLDQMANDRRRDRESRRNGYEPLRYHYEEVKYRPAKVADELREVLRPAA
jgi:hypothetical protein